MTPPDKIYFSQIILGERGRSTYHGIEQLAELILNNGLIQPLVLVPFPRGTEPGDDQQDFGLDAGGRRYHALKLLLDRGDWDGNLWHALTSDPKRPGYVLKGEAFCTPVQRLMTEIAENLGREDMDWRDQVKLIVKAKRTLTSDAHARGEEILMQDLGVMLGVQYTKLAAAVYVHDDLIANPDRYKDCYSIRGAWSKLLKVNEIELTKVQAERMATGAHLIEKPLVSVQSEQPQELAAEKPANIPLTKSFINCDSLEYMGQLTGPTFDHIVTDPDYGISVERLEANMSGAGAGVAQEGAEQSVKELLHFISLSFQCIKDGGFLVFWYDLDHHEKIQNHARAVGFAVQRWPLVWHKTDYKSNAAPAHNFCKNVEYAMVCRKKGAVLSRAQTSCIIAAASGTTVREFGHPFAKPLLVSQWVYSAIAIKGQTTYDPFMGSGAICCAAAEWGLKTVGSEIATDHYNNALMNLQRTYKKLLGNVTFS